MELRLGINNCFAVKRWPLADEWAEIVRAELDLGLVQHSLDVATDEPDTIRVACARHGLAIDSVFTGLIAYSSGLMLAPSAAERSRGVELWRDGIRFSARLGARSFGGHVGSLSRADADDPTRREERWGVVQSHLRDLSAEAKSLGLEALLVENMASDREPSRMSELESLMGDSDGQHAAVELCLDVGHQCVPGSSGMEADPYAWLQRMGRHAPVVHLQQSDAGGDHHWPFTREYNRRGRIDGARVVDALAESGATEAVLILEIIPAFEADDRRVLEELRESVHYWRETLRG